MLELTNDKRDELISLIVNLKDFDQRNVRASMKNVFVEHKGVRQVYSFAFLMAIKFIYDNYGYVIESFNDIKNPKDSYSDELKDVLGVISGVSFADYEKFEENCFHSGLAFFWGINYDAQ